MATLSRPALCALWAFGVPFVHVGGPWALAHAGARHGWVNGVASTWNIVGLVPALAGAALLAWSVVWHMRNAPERSRISTQVSYLVERGPYAYSRNPMYVAELVLWLGWAMFYGPCSTARSRSPPAWSCSGSR
jgi:protein-S-isoprenylcysteine O-methyltransferase Ste14